MHVSVYLPFLLSALFGALMPALSRRLPPHHATWLLSVGAAVLAVTSAGCLTLLALTAAARVPPIAAAGDLSIAALTRHDPVHEPIALAAVGAVIVLAAVFARALVRRVLAIGQIYRSARELPGTQLVVVVDTADDAAAVACAVPGRVGRILVSRDLLTGLPPDQRAALLGHEWSHLAHRHYLHQAVVDVAATLNPFLRSLPAATRFTTERWADEDAAAATGDRAVLARTVAAAGLMSRGARSAVASAVALPAGGSAVPQRVRALLAEPPRRRPGVTAVAAALVMLAGVAATDATWDAHQMLERAQDVSAARSA